MDVSVTLGIKGEDNNNDENNVGTGYNNNNVKKARLHSMLAALLDDPILADVPKKPALSDVDTVISLELGSAMRISVLKLDHTSIRTLKRHALFLPSSHLNKYVMYMSANDC